LQILFEDNHMLVVNKSPGEITQGDKTGDKTLPDICKDYIKESRNKPGNVFLHPVHRLDRPVSGIVVFALTSKALARLNKAFAGREVKKTYWALTHTEPSAPSGILINWLRKNEAQNKSYVVSDRVEGAREAKLDYRVLGRSERYTLIEIDLHTGRHHQIRAQLAHAGFIIRGDLKYGAPRSNRDGSISLHAVSLELAHPVAGNLLRFVAHLPPDGAWKPFEKLLSGN
jgi:23S rRNA pseudouridine1911/1915/1917 synthase